MAYRYGRRLAETVELYQDYRHVGYDQRTIAEKLGILHKSLKRALIRARHAGLL